MDIKDMSMDELMERRSAIAAELEQPEADLDALEAEVRSINEEIEARKAAEAQRGEVRKAVAEGAGEVIQNFEKEERKEEMTEKEIRSSKEYIDAFATYIKTGRDDECRALLTTNVSGQVPVPTIIEDRIRTAWQKNGLMDLVRKTYVRGNLKVGFELSADPAYVHTEGANASTEETLTFGIVSLTPESIKKWIDREAA